MAFAQVSCAQDQISENSVVESVVEDGESLEFPSSTTDKYIYNVTTFMSDDFSSSCCVKTITHYFDNGITRIKKTIDKDGSLVMEVWISRNCSYVTLSNGAIVTLSLIVFMLNLDRIMLEKQLLQEEKKIAENQHTMVMSQFMAMSTYLIILMTKLLYS